MARTAFVAEQAQGATFPIKSDDTAHYLRVDEELGGDTTPGDAICVANFCALAVSVSPPTPEQT